MLTGWGLVPQEVVLFGKFWKLQDVSSWLKEIAGGRAKGGILSLVPSPHTHTVSPIYGEVKSSPLPHALATGMPGDHELSSSETVSQDNFFLALCASVKHAVKAMKAARNTTAPSTPLRCHL